MATGFIDTTISTATHCKILTYIKKHITANVDIVTIPEFSQLISQYKTTKTGKSFAYGSVKSLFYTMMKHRQGDWNLMEMKTAKNKFWTKTHPTDNLYSQEKETQILDMILYYMQHLVSPMFNKEHPGILDNVSLAIAITVATNLRISEIKQLTLSHLHHMMRDEVVNIRTKKRSKGVVILAHKWLIEKIITLLITHAESALIITISTSCLNKHIKLKLADPTTVCGIQGIRKVNTTQLIKDGTITLAQTFNRHSNASTTQKYYNNQTYIGPIVNKVLAAQFMDVS